MTISLLDLVVPLVMMCPSSTVLIQALAASSPPTMTTPIPPPPPLSLPVWSLACPLSGSSARTKKEEGSSSSTATTSALPKESRTSMNIVTFATAVSVAPPKLWMVSLYNNTLTRRAMLDSGVGVLQLLVPQQADLVPLLGKRSGYEEGYSKREECGRAGWAWTPCRWSPPGRTARAGDDDTNREGQGRGDPDRDRDHGGGQVARAAPPAEPGVKESIDVLPNCAAYLALRLRQVVPAGDHDMALCEVIGTGEWNEDLDRVVGASLHTAAGVAAMDDTTVLYTQLLRKQGII